MNAIGKIATSNRYERTIETSKRVRWDIEKDVIRARRFDTTHKFLPDGLSLVDRVHDLVVPREAIREPDPGTHLRQHLRAG